MSVEKETKDSIYSLIPNEYKKSNFLIGSKYKSTLFEAKILAISLSRIKVVGNDIYSEITASELKKIIKPKNHSFYKELDNTAKCLAGRVIGMSNKEKEMFVYLPIISMAMYENGVLTTKFNPELKNYLVDIKSNFTKLPLSVLIKFNNVYAFRLYENIKAHCYKGPTVTFDIAELKFILGVANADEKPVKTILNNTKNPDYDAALEITTEKAHESYHSFKQRIIDKAVKEINEVSEFTLSYTPNRVGRGGKVKSLTFTITYKTDVIHEIDDKKIELSDEEKEIIIEQVMDNVIEEKLKMKDYKVICETAQYDIYRIQEAYKIMKQSKTKIDNITGWLISAIENEYQNVSAKKAQKNSFNNFEQRSVFDIDMDEFEKQILSN